MQYSEITYADKNPLKRYLHNKRFQDAGALLPNTSHVNKVLDYGGGDGELCLRLANIGYNSKFICYEPAPALFEQAQTNVSKNDKIVASINIEHIPSDSIDIVYCLEVFEHLPSTELQTAINRIFSILKPEGMLILGIPNELYLAALYKGIFRMTRRMGDYDTKLKNIFKCIMGNPPKDRPMGEISHGMRYHFHHLGFDHRSIIPILNEKFKLNRIFCSPFKFLGEWGTSELYYVFNKRIK